MRLLHLSDLHIGKRVNEFCMIEDQRHALEGIVRTIRERSIDALLIAGDLYDKSAPSAEAVALVDWFLAEAAATGAQVLAIAGNHDSAERVAYASSLLARQGVHLSPVYDGRIHAVELADEHGPVVFWLLPFLKPSLVRPFFPETAIASYTDALTAALSTCNLDTSLRNVVLSHQFVTWGATEPERCDSELNIGGVDNVDGRVYDDFDYVALGHIHRPQRIGRPEMRYSGSLLKYSLSEIRGAKSTPLVELGPKGSVAIELVPIEPLHDMRSIRGPLEELVQPAVVQDVDPNDYLQVVLTDEHPPLNALDRLRAVYPNVMSLEYDNRRTRARGIGDQALDDSFTERPLGEVFEEFYRLQNDQELTDHQRTAVTAALEECEVH